MAHQEDAGRADEKHQCHDNKADPVDHPSDQNPFFIFLEWSKMFNVNYSLLLSAQTCWNQRAAPLEKLVNDSIWLLGSIKVRWNFVGAYTLEVVLLSCSLCYVFAGGHTLPQLWRGLCQTDTKLLLCASFKSIICVRDKSQSYAALVLKQLQFDSTFTHT